MPQAAHPKLAVLVTGASEAGLRRFLMRYVKSAFGMAKNQWRASYRTQYALVVLSRPLRADEDAAVAYGPYAGAGALVLAALDPALPGSGRDAARAWLADAGFSPVAELKVAVDCAESQRIEQGAEVVNFINLHCPWRCNSNVRS
jgi:hypothetical protein